jgi:hypothetical protein
VERALPRTLLIPSERSWIHRPRFAKGVPALWRIEE